MVARSAQSRAVLEAARRLGHPTADEVFHAVRETFPRVSLATVYRNLGRLVEEGELRLREIGGEKRYDANVEPHLHIHDSETDLLIDVPIPPKLRDGLAEIAAEYLERHETSVIELTGRLKGLPSARRGAARRSRGEATVHQPGE